MNVRELIAGEEAKNGKPIPWVYDDATGEFIVKGYTVQGHPTIGLGTCVEKGVAPGLPISALQHVFDVAISALTVHLDNQYPGWFGKLDEVRRAALISAVYNLGIPHFNEFHKAIAACAKGQWTEAAAQFRDSAWWRSRDKPRAEQVAQMIETGEWPQ